MCGQHDDRHTTVIAVVVKYFTLLLIVTPSICSQISKLHFEYCWSFDMFDWDTFLTPAFLYGSQVYVGETQNVVFILKTLENWTEGSILFFVLKDFTTEMNFKSLCQNIGLKFTH